MTSSFAVETFIARWQGVTASELASAQSFVTDLCGPLGLTPPHPTPEQDYVFERPITFRHGDGGSNAGRIDCYRRGCFVLDAYGLHDHPSDEQILERLVALNAERIAEEAVGTVRWLHPDFQVPGSAQAAIGLESGRSGRRNLSDGAMSLPASAPAPTAAQNWPVTLPEQLATLAAALGSTRQTESQLAATFTGKGRWESRLPDILEAMAALGRARRVDDGRWMG